MIRRSALPERFRRAHQNTGLMDGKSGSYFGTRMRLNGLNLQTILTEPT